MLPETSITSITVATVPSLWEVARTYLVLGVEHILTGYDHLLFVVSLVLLLGELWVVVRAATAFLLDDDVLIDAGPSGEDDPENALDNTVEFPDGTVIERPGSLYHYMTEPALWGTNDDFVAMLTGTTASSTYV